jgi:capsular polysaccharide biosynthesis protein
MVSDGERTAAASRDATDDPAERFPVFGDFTAADSPPDEEYSTGLPGLRFIMSAVRRSAWFWAATGAIGLVIGFGLYVAHPSYQATATVVLTPNPAELPTDAVLTDIALAQSQAVAVRAVRELGLSESASSFVRTYKVTDVTDRIIQFTLTAPSSSEAVTRTNGLATAFLQFRAEQAQAQQQHVLAALQAQVSQAKQQINAMSRQINRLSAQPASPKQQAALSALQAERTQAQTQLPALVQAVTGNEVSTRLSATEMVRGSQILDPATATPPSRFKHGGVYVGGGLFGGLAVGLGLVIVRELLSDRLRWRDDIAHALDAPIKISVRPLRSLRWLPGRGGLAAARGDDLRRLVKHLRDAVPRGPRRATLAVVAVDDTSMAAVSLVTLAVSFAQEGRRVVLADLCRGAPAARLLGVKRPGVGVASADGAQLVVAVPGDGGAPVGPLRNSSSAVLPTPELAEACASADLLLTLVNLAPATGGEHLATWATGAVVMVTAGQSSWTRIHAVADMIRLAGTSLLSAVLVTADKADEGLGITLGPAAGATLATVDPEPRISSR